MDLHPALSGCGPSVVKEALWLATGIPAAACCSAGGLTRLPKQACNPDTPASVHTSTSPTLEQPAANLFTPEVGSSVVQPLKLQAFAPIFQQLPSSHECIM